MVPVPILPFKAFVACTAAMGASRSRFMLVLAPARIIRYGALAYLGQQVGENSAAWLTSHFWHLLGVAAGIALVLWLLIRRAERARVAGNYNEGSS
jgi:uncharacterized membrane protein YdjX (TVP38/TMEM64 family)